MANISNIKLPNGSVYGFNADTVDNIHIKTTTITATTDENGNFILWNVSATKVPFFCLCVKYIQYNLQTVYRKQQSKLDDGY